MKQQIEIEERVKTIVPQGRDAILEYLSLVAVLFGIVVRLSQYLSNRSLWGDEVNLALNIVDRSYLELLQPLDHNQAAPPGFLWIEKATVQLLGNTEYALRLFPLISGLVALVVFYRLANRYVSEIAAPIAIALFACLKYIVYYTTEVKQYSSDVMIAVVLCSLLIPLRHQVLDNKQLLLLGGLGALCIWISHPTVFVLAGIEVGYFLVASNQKRLSLLMNRWPMYVTWLISFAGLYFLTVRGTLKNDVLTSAWDARFPDSPFDIVWLLDTFGRFFYNPLGFLGFTDGIALFVFIVGCIAFYYRDRIILLGVTAPILITLIASYLQQYPFRERLVLFLAPFAVLIIAEGIAFLLTKPQKRYKLLRLIGIIIAVTLLLPSIANAGQLIVAPLKLEEIKPVIAYVQTHQQPNDRLYVYAPAENQFTYYGEKYGYEPGEYMLGETNLATGRGKNRKVSQKAVKQFKQEIRKFQGEQRVWFLFSRASEEEEQALIAALEPIGQQLDAFKQPGAAAYLYTLK